MRQLRKLGHLTGYRLLARDGEIGKLREVYFDDQQWVVRYFVVHTGSWLFGKDVLIVPAVVSAIDEDNAHLEVDLLREQIENCPPVNTAVPVSRHYETEYYRYYGWQPYWGADPMFGPTPILPLPVDEAAPDQAEQPKQPQNPHLRSSDEVASYHIHARDGDIGHVKDFILDDQDWAIRYLEINTRNWLPGKDVLIAPAWIEAINWESRAVSVELTREAIQSAPSYDDTMLISRDYQVALYQHYGKTFDQE